MSAGRAGRALLGWAARLDRGEASSNRIVWVSSERGELSPKKEDRFLFGCYQEAVEAAAVALKHEPLLARAKFVAVYRKAKPVQEVVTVDEEERRLRDVVVDVARRMNECRQLSPHVLYDAVDTLESFLTHVDLWKRGRR